MEQTPRAKYGNGQHLQYPGAALDMLSLLRLVLHTFSRNLDCWTKGVFFLVLLGCMQGGATLYSFYGFDKGYS